MNLPNNNAMGGDEPEALERKPMSEGAPEDTSTQFGRMPLNQPRNLDADPYIREHPDKKLMWVNDLGGDVQRWIDAGAEPVPVKRKSSRTFEGITQDSEWVRVVGGENKDGSPFWVYLLMIDPDLYAHLVTEPEKERRRGIHASMYRGKDQSGGSGLASYAPNLPTGDVGMNVAHEVEQ